MHVRVTEYVFSCMYNSHVYIYKPVVFFHPQLQESGL